LILSGSLRLPIALADGIDRGNGARAPYFRAVRFSLDDRQGTLATAESKGEQPGAVLTTALDRAATLDPVRALAGRDSSLLVEAAATTGGRAGATTRTASLVDLAREAAGSLETWGRLLAPDPSTGELRPVPSRTRSTGARGMTRAVRDVTPVGRDFATVSA